ncbi:sensor histidine kinase [Pseudonocardia sp. WMMC193]|uniref:sensor histidine kinase n=1 Tax=Pseudonocardia sp. WMMC193 TaxID=2911965 RepID=UPI001F225A85|nr:ATP-binding protein [Pseudonocardia sp. WMMC193]MCF7551226.1 ATP-binding protein [Pseudonocardia sp. WMMC193]
MLRHAALVAAAGLVVSALVTLGVWLVARDEAGRTAERVSRQVAQAVAVPLEDRDLREPGLRAGVLADLEPFLRSGMVFRIKIWLVEGANVRIVFSDEARVETESRPFDPELARRLDAGEAVVLEVPDDAEHRFEIDRAGALREVFLGFTDAAGNPARFEVYVPVDVSGTIRYAMQVLLPLALVGVFGLGVVLLVLARGVDRVRRERQDALHYGLAAAELARRDLARRLHDDVVPDLASAGLMLDLAETDPALVARARGVVADNVRRLRSVLTDLVPPAVTGADAPAAFARLGAGLGAEVQVAPDLRMGTDAAVLLHRIAGELLRNAVAHSGAERITLRVGRGEPGWAVVEVEDDGRGFDPAAGPAEGHLGLLLVRRAVEDAGGRMTITSAPGEGARVAVTVPEAHAPAPV